MFFNIKKVFLTSGVGVGGTSLNAFDNAMRVAKIADFNIIKVTSIVPSGIQVEKIDKSKKIILGNGCLLPAVYESITSSKIGKTITAGVGIGISKKNNHAGIIFTLSAYCKEETAKRKLNQMIEEGMAQMRLIHEYKFIHMISSSKVTVKNTCAFASAVFADENLIPLFEK